MKTKKIIEIIGILTILFCLSGCFSLDGFLKEEEEEPKVKFVSASEQKALDEAAAAEKVKSIEIKNKDIGIKVAKDREVRLELLVEPEDVWSGDVEWTISDNTIASVSADGIVKGLNYGVTRVTAKAAGKKDYANIIVINPIGLERLFSPSAVKDGKFGDKIGLSADGSTLAVSASGMKKVFVYELKEDKFDFSMELPVPEDRTAKPAECISLSEDGSLIAVSNYYDNHSGAVYIYKKTGSDWLLEKVIEGPYVANRSGYGRNQFGWSNELSRDGSWLFVSAVTENVSGRVHVYKNDGDWAEVQVLEPETTRLREMFGYDISLSADGKLAAITSVSADNYNQNEGKIYAYRLDEEWNLTGVADLLGEREGHSVAISGESLEVFTGAPNSNVVKSSKTFLEQPRGLKIRKFGKSISVSDDGKVLLVGAPSGSLGGGVAVLFRYSAGKWYYSWEQMIFSPSKAVNYKSWQGVGEDVSLSADGSIAVTGAAKENKGAIIDAGAVYYRVFQ